MDDAKRQRILDLVNSMDNSEEARSAFIRQPVETLKRALELDIDENAAEIGPTNQILTALLAEPKAISALSEIAADHDHGELSADDARKSVIAVLEEHLPAFDLQKMIEEWRRTVRTPIDLNNLPKYEPEPAPDPQAIANPVVAVDALAVITSLVVIHSEYVVSGKSGGYPVGDIRRIATIIARE
jgi:hypothetical protein